MLPESLEAPIIRYVHASPGHAGVDKYVWEINQSFHLKNIGCKVANLAHHVISGKELNIRTGRQT
jgi:hypothetical protein